MDLKRIVIGIDFSPASADAARWAAMHFGKGAELVLVHAVSSTDSPRSGHGDDGRDLSTERLREDAERRLRDMASSISAERIEFEVPASDAKHSLPAIATELKADLLIVGARGEHAERDRSLGTTAQHAVRESSVPVLVVAQPHERAISRILVPVDDDAVARESLRWAALLSDRFNAVVTTLHINTAGAMRQSAAAPPGNGKSIPGATQSDQGRDSSAANRWMELATAAGIDTARVTCEEVTGVPAVEIASASKRNAVDIIVMGRRAERNLKRAVLGSVTATVLSNPPCSVLVVPAT